MVVVQEGANTLGMFAPRSAPAMPVKRCHAILVGQIDACVTKMLPRRAAPRRAASLRRRRQRPRPLGGGFCRFPAGLGLSALTSEPVTAAELRWMAQQPLWVDPATGYLRRLVSAPGADGEVEIVAVELPAGQTVTFAATQSLHSQDRIVLLEGRLHLRSADAVYELQPGDWARISTTRENAFGNPGAVPARYLVVKRHHR